MIARLIIQYSATLEKITLYEKSFPSFCEDPTEMQKYQE